MTARAWHRASLRAGRSREGGYVAVMTALMLIVLMSLAAFAVDVGRWYVVGQQEQRAADAAALAGVTSLPANSSAAYAAARSFSRVNGFEDGVNATTVTPGLDRPTRLRVTVKRTVNNIFGSLLGVPTTTVARTAVADFGGPVPMGSPCNTFGNDPDPGSNRGASCSGVLGEMWANVNSRSSLKANGDAYQSNSGCSASVDGCSGSTNTDYATDGYFYTVSVKAAMSSLTIELFDPVSVNVALTCNSTNFGTLDGTTEGVDADNDVVSDETTRYKSLAVGPAGDLPRPYCTGDNIYSGSTVMNTQFTVRDPSTSLWDPVTFPLHAGCQVTYPGYTGSLFDVLDQYTSGTTPRGTYNATIANGFRRWTTLCTIANPVVGDYLVQVKTNGLSSDSANAGNRFSIRAYGSGSGDKESVSISGRERMSIFSNKPGVMTEFHLARVPTGAAGQVFNVDLFDVGDSNQTGTINIVAPPDAAGDAFTNCTGSGPASGTLANCSFQVIWLGTVSDHQGKWQTVSVPIPSNYRCDDLDPAACWVRLQYDYGGGSAPTDVTSWSGGLDGDPVRLVE